MDEPTMEELTTDEISSSESALSSDLDFTMLPELFLDTRDAHRNDVGALANIFLKAFTDDPTAQLLYPRDGIWPVVIDMLRQYLDDEATRVVLAWDEYTDTVVGWTAVSLVSAEQDDRFKWCDSTVWAGRQLLRKEARARGQAPLHVDEMKRAALITELRRRNREGQTKFVEEAQQQPQPQQKQQRHLVINTIAVHPDVFEDEISEIAYKLIDHVRDLAKEHRLPLWAQVPQNSLGHPEELFAEVGFAQVGSFALNLVRYANDKQRERREWGVQEWTQWVLRVGNWEHGRRYDPL